MDVWPIKCYVPIADETIARSAFGVKGMNASVYINPLPLELCTEVTNTYLSAYIRARYSLGSAAVFRLQMFLRNVLSYLPASLPQWYNWLRLSVSSTEYPKVNISDIKKTARRRGKEKGKRRSEAEERHEEMSRLQRVR